MKKKSDLLEIVSQIQVNQPKPNGKIPTLDPPMEIKKTIDEVVEWKRREKEARSEREARESDIIEWVRKKQDEDGFEGNYHKSYKLAGIKETVTYTASDKFSCIPQEALAQVKVILKDKFDDYIKRKIILRVKEEVFADEELQQELLSLVGKENFPKFFESEIKWEATDDFDIRIYSLPQGIVEKLRTIIKQAKPSIR